MATDWVVRRWDWDLVNFEVTACQAEAIAQAWRTEAGTKRHKRLINEQELFFFLIFPKQQGQSMVLLSRAVPYAYVAWRRKLVCQNSPGTELRTDRGIDLETPLFGPFPNVGDSP